MSVTDAAKLLGVSRPVIYRMIADKALIPVPQPISPYQKRVRRLLLNRADVERLAAYPTPGRPLVMSEDPADYTP